MALKNVVVILCLGSASLLSQRTQAYETDQYSSWGIELKDGSAPLDQYVQNLFTKTLRGTPLQDLGPGPENCLGAALRIHTRLRHRIWWDREIHMSAVLKKIEMYPGPEVGSWNFYRNSIYGKRTTWPYYMPLDRTINFAGVYLAVDKISHFVSQGAKYYEVYLSAIRTGESETRAMEMAVEWGLAREDGLYGKYSSAVFSYADLEANWSGFLAILDACHGSDPALKWTDEKGWQYTRPFLISKYVNARWDESFNTSRYAKYRWKSVRPRLLKYCELRNHPSVLKRFAEYQIRLEPSWNEKFIRRLESEGKLPLQSSHSLDKLCDETN